MNTAKNKNEPLVSVSLLLWRSEKFIKNCLESLFAQTHNNLELFLADNNDSSDKGVKIAKEILEKNKDKYHIEFVNHGKNIGFAAGHNLSIIKAKGKYILLLNQDVVLANNFLEEAVKVLESDEKIAAIQSRCLRLKQSDGQWKKTDIIDNFGLVMLKNRRVIGRGQGQLSSGKFLAQEEIFGVDGAAPVFRKAFLEEVKICLVDKCEYLDEDFFSYKEDVDLAWRLRLLGGKAVYAPQVTAWHARGSGDSAAKNYFGIIRERMKISQFAKELSFKNQRLMQFKNEQKRLLFRHLPWFLPKEIAALIYVILFESFAWRTFKNLIRQTPKAWQKRKIIMARKRVSAKEMGRWFE